MEGYTYVLSDIHGHADRFDSVMKQIKLKPQDTLYVLGDVIDRNSDGIRILRKLMAMPNVKMLLGNHEYMMLDALYYHVDELSEPWDPYGPNRFFRVWYANGGEITHYYMKHQRIFTRADIFNYLTALPLNIELEVSGKQYRLVHGGFDDHSSDPSNTYHAVWDRLTRFDEMPAGKTVIFGHTPTLKYQDATPSRIWYGESRIGIDCGCAYSIGRLACLRLDDMKEYYSVS